MFYCKALYFSYFSEFLGLGGGTITLCLLFQQTVDIFSDIYFPFVTLKPKSTRSLPGHHRPSRNRVKRPALSLYSNPTSTTSYDLNHTPSQSSLYSSTCQQSAYRYYASRFPYNYSESSFKGLPISNADNCKYKHALSELHESKHRDALNEKCGLAEDYRWVPIFLDVDERADSSGKIGMGYEEEPVYYDCDSNAKTSYDGNGIFGRNFDVRGLTIREESFGEV